MVIEMTGAQFWNKKVEINWLVLNRIVDRDIEKEVKEMITQIQGGTTNGQQH